MTLSLIAGILIGIAISYFVSLFKKPSETHIQFVVDMANGEVKPFVSN